MQIDRRTRLLAWLLDRRQPIETLSLAQIQAANARPLAPWLAWIFLGAAPPLPRFATIGSPADTAISPCGSTTRKPIERYLWRSFSMVAVG